MGLGATILAQTIRQVGTDDNWLEILANLYNQTLALKTDTTLWRWGLNAPYCLDCNITITPSQIGSDHWKEVYKGPSGQSAGIKQMAHYGNGILYFGIIMHNFQIQYKVGNDKNWKSVALGIGYVIAIKEDNTLWGWGLNDKGVLGDGTTTSQVK